MVPLESVAVAMLAQAAGHVRGPLADYLQAISNAGETDSYDDVAGPGSAAAYRTVNGNAQVAPLPSASELAYARSMARAGLDLAEAVARYRRVTGAPAGPGQRSAAAGDDPDAVLASRILEFWRRALNAALVAEPTP